MSENQIIIAITGKKGSGKTTLSRYLHGHQLMGYRKIKSFDVVGNQFLVEIEGVDENNEPKTVKGELDIERVDDDFAGYAEVHVWPFVKNYSFATPFKEFLIDFFDLPRENIYGDDDKKNELSPFTWENMPDKPKGKSGVMTFRELMQHFGGTIMRKMKDTIWIDFLKKRISNEGSALCIIPDLRYKNEFDAIKELGGIVVKLVRSDRSEDTHSSEKELEEIVPDFEIDNTNLTPHETYQKVLEYLSSNDYTKEFSLEDSSSPKETENPRKHTVSTKSKN